MNNKSFVFPGQGSQSIGMLSALADMYPVVGETFKEASESVGFDVWQLVQEGPEDKLSQTEYTQVSMLAADVAVYRILEQENKHQCHVMAGHSLGEYAALVCAKAISLAEAAPLVMKRGQLMQENVPLGTGAMAAIIGLSDSDVDALCQQASIAKEQVSPANYNAIGQVVVAGHTPAVERAVQNASDRGAVLAKIIPVSVPCHCSLLTDAADKYAEYLDKITFKVPEVNVISNVDLCVYENDRQIRERLREQLYSPVRWVETIQIMNKMGVDTVIECGPGKVLTGLVKRINRQLTAISLTDPKSFNKI